MDLRENERRIIWGKSRLQRGSREERNVIDATKTCLIGGANPTMTQPIDVLKIVSSPDCPFPSRPSRSCGLRG